MTNSEFDSFRRYIRAEIRGMSGAKICRFAWLCSVRALPFMSVRRGFSYWHSKYIQKHLYSIFRAVDIAAYVATTFDKVLLTEFSIADAAAVAARAADATAVAADAAAADAAADADAYFAYSTAAYAVYAAFTATANAARAAARASNAAAYVARAAAYAARAAACAENFSNVFSVKTDFRDIILNDLSIIQNNQHDTFKDITDVYPELLTAFISDLNKIGCSYWANIYVSIVKSNYKVYEDALKRRLEVPMSVQERGAAAVANYLENIIAHGAKHMDEARVIILGDKGSGKTSLARKILNPGAKLPRGDESTAAVDILAWSLRDKLWKRLVKKVFIMKRLPVNKNINPDIIYPTKKTYNALRTHIWDFAGHVVTHTAHRFFLAERCIYVIVYNGRTERDSQNELEYWLNHVRNYGGGSPIYIVVNEWDEHKPEVDEIGLKEKYPSLRKVVRMSLLKDKKELYNFRNELGQLVRENPPWNNEIPTTWYKAKERLEKLFSEEGQELIKTEKFQEIALGSGIDFKDIEMVRGSLHALGICLHYDEIHGLDTYVLNPTWITHGVYSIINWVKDGDRQGKLLGDDLLVIFKRELQRYPKERHDFLLQLMQKYELAYPLNGMQNTYILPLALPVSTPKKHMKEAFILKDSLLMRYRVSGALPPDTITRFIVRRHTEIASENNGKQLVWRKGVLLTNNNDSEALVTESGLSINIAVKGINAKDFLEDIKNTLGDIFSEYKCDDPTLEYAVSEGRYFAKDEIFSMGDWLYLEKIEPINKKDILKKYGFNIIMLETIDEEEVVEIQRLLLGFLKSERERAFSPEQSEKWIHRLTNSSKQGLIAGKRLISECLSDVANLTAIGTAFNMYLSEHPDIPKNVMMFLQQLISK